MGNRTTIITVDKQPDVTGIMRYWDVDIVNCRAVHRATGLVLAFSFVENSWSELNVDILHHGDLETASEDQLEIVVSAGVKVYVREYFREQ